MERIYHIFSFNELKPLIFTQLDFWLFFIFVMLVFSFLHKKLLTRSIFLSVVSIFFYYKTSGIYVTLLIVSLFANYFLGNRIEKAKTNSSRNIQQGAKNIDMLNMWADLRNEGKTEEEIEQIIEEKEKEEKQKIKPLDITSWTNPVKNAKTRYAFQVGKKGVGIGAVGITNHAVNQLVNSLGVGFDATTIYFTTNPTEVIDINGKRKTVTSLSFTRDSNGEWISNNISEFITSFVDVAKDPFIIRINGNSNTAGSYIIANKLGMSLEDTILLFNQPIVREYEKLEALRSKDLNPKWSKESVLIETLNKYGKPGYINYIDGNFVPVLSALKKERLDVFETEELEEFIKNKYNPNEQRVEQTILLATYLEIKNGSNSLLKAVSEYNWDTANITDNLQVIVKNKEILDNFGLNESKKRQSESKD